MGNPIRFGTSGWRAVIGEEFTFPNVRLAVAAIAEHVRSASRASKLVVGYDTRFFSEEFARTAAAVLRARGVRALLCSEATPTPAIAYETLRHKADGAINFTASHNPAEYNGIKFSGPDGGPALPEVTRDIEKHVEILAARGAAESPAADEQNGFERIDPRGPYLARLAELVRFDELRKVKLRIVCDAMHGCGAGYLDGVLAEQGTGATAIRTSRDVLFDGHGPDPSETNLAPLAQEMRARNAQVGLATDGDADRFGILDADGSFISPNHILALLYDYLVESRGWRLGAARSVATSHLLDAVARFHGLPLHQTPVGFKYIGALLREDKIALGGEESAGLTIRGHVPEKDGILACLLVAEMIAVRRATLTEQIHALFQRVGREFWPVRVNLHLAEEVSTGLLVRLRGEFREFLGRPVAQTDRTDGLKLIFGDGAWVLLRLSGTEPLVRIYTEAASLEAAKQMAEGSKKWILQ